MATFEKQTAKVLATRILGCNELIDHFYEKKNLSSLTKREKQVAQDRFTYWIAKRSTYVELAMDLFIIEENVSCSNDRTVLEELEKILG